MKPGLNPSTVTSLNPHPAPPIFGEHTGHAGASRAPVDGTRERLIDEAHGLLAQGGLKALSVRNLAAAAGLSTSAVPYHLGDKDSLTQTVFLAAADRDRRAWAAFRDTLGDGALPAFGLADALIAHTLNPPADRATIELVWYELIHQARHTPALRPILADWFEERRNNHRDLFALAGLPHHVADIVLHYLVGDQLTVLVPGGTAGFALAILEALRHLCDPVDGPPSLWHGRLRPPSTSDMVMEPAGETEQRIIAAAVATIIDQGVASVTHRAVAHRADVSLSSTTYYFRSRGDIIRRAFQSIHGELRREVPELDRKPPALPDFLRAAANNMLTPVEGGRIAGRNTIHAMADFALECCRDPSLAPLYLAFRQSRGARMGAAIRWVQGSDAALPPFQAQLLSSWMQGRAQILTSLEDQPDVEAYARELAGLLRYLQPVSG
ncbi:MAG: TetR family transcriptional regulator [Azospirillaceae bacterium]|nr:TetR family transcriptional regulator [Azospirillaceae bacterium]